MTSLSDTNASATCSCAHIFPAAISDYRGGKLTYIGGLT
jgi:hypothetical protein